MNQGSIYERAVFYDEHRISSFKLFIESFLVYETIKNTASLRQF